MWRGAARRRLQIGDRGFWLCYLSMFNVGSSMFNVRIHPKGECDRHPSSPFGLRRDRQECLSYSLLCDPSQNGGVEVCLHWQSHAGPLSSGVWARGVKSVPLWDPSQKGWVPDFPQVQNQISSPAFRGTSIGLLAAMSGFMYFPGLWFGPSRGENEKVSDLISILLLRKTKR